MDKSWDEMSRDEKLDRARMLIQTTMAWQCQELGIAFNNLWHEMLISVRLDHLHTRRDMIIELNQEAEKWVAMSEQSY